MGLKHLVDHRENIAELLEANAVVVEVGEWLVWAAGEVLMYAVSLPALYGAAYFAMQYLTTLWLRPNTWRIHWMMAAVGYGLAASFFLLAAGPLLGRWLDLGLPH